MDLSPDTLRAAFQEKTDAFNAIEAQLEPLRAELADLVAGETELSVKQAQAREAALRAEIKALQDQAYPIEMERAALVRALGGKTSG